MPLLVVNAVSIIAKIYSIYIMKYQIQTQFQFNFNITLSMYVYLYKFNENSFILYIINY